MIKTFVISLLLLTINLYAWPQAEPDTLVNEETTDCEEIAYHSTFLIMKYYRVHDYDSALLVLNDWQTACGAIEPVVRTRILLAINDHAFDESVYDSTIVDAVLNYMQRIESKKPEDFYADYPAYFGYVPIRGEYDYFTQSLADTLLSAGFDTPIELLFCEFYANVLQNPFRNLLTDSLFAGTDLKRYYEALVNKSLSKPDYHYNLFSGVWIPTGNASLLGVHPVIGAQVGIKYHRMTYNLSLAFKFVNSPNDYVIYKDGYTDTTNYFLGGYIGLDLEREILKGKKHELDFLLGVGYDGFESLKTNLDETDANAGHSINSINTNFGLGYRFFFKKNRYVGLQAKYNIVNYNNSGGTNLMGDCITVSIVLGGYENPDKESELYELRYSD